MTAKQILLPADLDQFVQHQVASGAYDTESEVVGDALRLLQLHEKEREALLHRLRQEVQVGLDELDRGEGIPASEVFAELRQRNADLQSSS